jgi:hypothetical protein
MMNSERSETQKSEREVILKLHKDGNLTER